MLARFATPGSQNGLFRYNGALEHTPDKITIEPR